MTGQASGQEAVDYAEIQAAEDAIIDAIRARHPEERAQILTRAEAEFVGPAPVDWSDLVWAAVLTVVTALALARLHGLSDRSQGAVLGFALAGVLNSLWYFGASVVEHVRGARL